MPYREEPQSTLLFVSFGSAVRALDPSTGEIVWQNDTVITSAGGTVLVVGKRVLSAGYGELACLDAGTGKTIWQHGTEVKGRCSLLVEDDRIYIAGRGEAQCFSFAGEVLWHQPFKGGGTGAVAIALGAQSARDDSDT